MFMMNIVRGPFIRLLCTLALSRINRKKTKTDKEEERRMKRKAKDNQRKSRDE
jgi:hypothetical protein